MLDVLPDEDVSTDDIDLLDDDLVHVICLVCNPILPKALETFVAMCGKKTIAHTGEALDEVPPNVCTKCIRTPVCPVCGS